MTEQNIQDKLLQKLNEYNENLLDDGFSPGSKLKKSRKTDSESVTTDTKSMNSKLNRRKKKKERKRRQKEGSVKCDDIKKNNECELTGEKRTLYEMKRELGLEEFEREEKCDKPEEKLNSKCGPEVVIYENPSKRKRKLTDTVSKRRRKGGGNDDEEFNMKRARYEVRKFGIKGFEGSKKDEAMVALLVQLGAKPPKKKYYNYKEFIQMKKDEKVKQKNQREIDRSLGYKVAPNRGERKKKDRNDVGGYIDGQVGKFKDGVQFVKKAELKGFKKKGK